MKRDLSALSRWLCNLGVLLMLVDILRPDFPLPLGDLGLVAAFSGLLTLLADDILGRKRRTI